MKRKALYLILIAVAAFAAVWGFSLIKCEILTAKYYNDFEYAYVENTMLEEIEYFKVLSCDGESAEVYYVSKNKTDGNILTFARQGDDWVETEWKTVWSKTGSASGAVWPYWWQIFVTGF